MKEIFKEHLFNKGILVGDTDTTPKDNFECLFSLANILGIRVVKGKSFASREVLKFAASQKGVNIPEPFYRGFPESIRKLSRDELLFDQLYSYFTTYGMGYFEDPAHSVLEEDFERTAFREKVTPRDFCIISEAEAEVELNKYVSNLLTSTRPLSDYQYQAVLVSLIEYDFRPTTCASKDTAIRLSLDTRSTKYLSWLRLPDFIRVVELLNYYDYNSENVNKINLKNKDRVYLSRVLDILLDKVDDYLIEECYEKRDAWCGYLHHVHYKPKTELASNFVNQMRGGDNHSVYATFEKQMLSGDVIGAVNTLVDNKGTASFMRKLNYILSRCDTEEKLAYVISKLDTKNNVVLIQMLLQYANYKYEGERTFKFTRFNTLKTHVESNDEVSRRKSMLSVEVVERVMSILRDILKRNYSGKLGKVYIDEDMKNIALPIQENTSMGGYGMLPRGSRVNLPEGKKMRAFTYWEKVNDVDLSIIGVDDDLNQTEFSWRTMFDAQSEAICYSGDETSGYYGGSEYFDIDFDLIKIKYPKIKYFILCNNVYSGTNFDKCVCNAGFMMRDVVDSGEVFEPKTVTSKYVINCPSTFAYLYAIDVESRQIIWLNTAKSSDEIVAGNTKVGFLLDYLNATDVINMHSFFTMLSSEIVLDPLDADLVVSDKSVQTTEGVEIVHSYDIDKVLSYVNIK